MPESETGSESERRFTKIQTLSLLNVKLDDVAAPARRALDERIRSISSHPNCLGVSLVKKEDIPCEVIVFSSRIPHQASLKSVG